MNFIIYSIVCGVLMTAMDFILEQRAACVCVSGRLLISIENKSLFDRYECVLVSLA